MLGMRVGGKRGKNNSRTSFGECASTQECAAQTVSSQDDLITDQAYDLKTGEFLDYFRDGVYGLGVRQQTVGDGCDDVKGALQQFPRVSPIQLPGAEHTFDAVPSHRQGQKPDCFILNMHSNR